MSEDIHLLKQERQATLEQQFLAPTPTVAGQTLHPFTAGRKLLLRALKNELLSGKELSQMEDADYAVLEFLYLHTLADKEATRLAYGDRQQWKESVVAFACKCSASMDSEVLAVMDILKQARLADVEVEAKPMPIGHADDTDPPPNS
jgi:ABC-type branched-subunit amino acid transport system ATPase component